MTYLPVPRPALGTPPPGDVAPAVRFGAWLVDVGDELVAGDHLCEVLIPGVAVTVPAPANGTLVRANAKPGDVLDGDEPLGWIETERA